MGFRSFYRHHNKHNRPDSTYEFSAFSGADIVGPDKDYLALGRTFVMPAVAAACITVTDNDKSLSGDSWRNERGNDRSGQVADIEYGGAQVHGDVKIYAEQYYFLRGSDGKIYKLLEIEIAGVSRHADDTVDFYTFIGDVPPAGVSLTAIGVRNVWRGVDYEDLGAGPKAEDPEFGTGDTVGGAVEIVDGAPNENTFTHTATGTIDFIDNVGDNHTVSVVPDAAGYRGTMTATVTDTADVDGDGQVTWEFSVADSALDDLAEGQTVVQTYEIVLEDSSGGTDVKTVTITLTGKNDVPVFGEVVEFQQGFETDRDGFFDDTNGWQGGITLVASGTNGIASPDGAQHAIFEQGGSGGSGPFTRFDGYRAAFNGDWVAEVKVYLDTSWALGEGFDYSVASNGSDGAHQRDFIFHVTKDTSTGDLLVGGSNNTSFDPRENLETINSYVVSASDWYTLQHVFRNDAGVLSVDLNLVDSGGTVVWTETRTDASDTIGATGAVGGNRYGWFTNIDIAGGIAVDTASLNVPDYQEPQLAEILYGPAPGEEITATGDLPFEDVDLIDTHTASASFSSATLSTGDPVDPGLLAALGTAMTALVSDASTGDGAGQVTWDFALDAAAAEILDAGEVLTAKYAVTVTDNQATNDVVEVVVTITGSADAAPGQVLVLDSGGNIVYTTNTVQDAIDNTTADGQTILVGDGTYTENVVIDRPLTLISQNGRDAVTIEGISSAGALGTVKVDPGVNDVKIGGIGTGFHIIGIDNGNGAVENGAIYLQGSQDGFSLLDNEIEANGEHGLVSEFGGALTNAVIDGNEFSGQTFQGAQPGGIGFSTQFNAVNNVPRQLVVIGEGGGGPHNSGNITFTNNLLSGTTGGISSDDNVSEQGNTMVTIDVDGATISDNTFVGETARLATALRARGPDTDIENNTFDNSSGGDTRGVFVVDQGVPGSYAGNVFIGGTDDDRFAGSPGDDQMNGDAGNDVFFGGLGNDNIGGDGDHDTSVYLGPCLNYSYTYDVDINGFATGFTSVTDNVAIDGDEGADALDSIEVLSFLGDGKVLDVGQPVQLFDTANHLIGTFDNIQEAVDASSAGDTIRLASGTIDLAGAGDAQVQISHDLTIIGAGKGVSTVVPVADTGSSGDSRGMFLVDDGVTLNVSDLTVDGMGFLVHQAFRHKGSGAFDNVEFTEIKYNESGPNYAGIAVVVFGTASHVDVTNSDFSEIGRVGVLYFGDGVTGTFQDNTYIGKGAGDFLDYAVDISAGAVIDVIGNTISDNQGVASSDGSTSAGILVTTFFGPGTTANLTDNVFTDNSTGVFVGFDENDTSTVDLVSGNVATGGTGVEVRGNAVVTNGDAFDGDFNWIAGDNGNTLESGDQADTLRGGSGSDGFIGNGGDDIFVFGFAEANDGTTDLDVIFDFDFSEIDDDDDYDDDDDDDDDGDNDDGNNYNDAIHLIDGVTAVSVVDDGFGNALITLSGADGDRILVLDTTTSDVNDNLFIV